MSRELKFKGWNSIVCRMSEPMTLREIYETKGVQWHIIDWLQYTGLKDKNGVEIYDGDVLSGFPHGTVAVKWDNDYGCFTCYDKKTDYGLFGSELDNCKDSWEVIGNIYEKPKLLNEM
jgi:uncharacterized phage protein (TIGR01671 family)